MINTSKFIFIFISYYVLVSFLPTTSSKLFAEHEQIAVPESIIQDSRTMSWADFKQAHKDIFPLSHVHPAIRYVENQYYFELKKNNFKDYTTKDRIILMYLHGILDKLIESNLDVLSRQGRYDPVNLDYLIWEINYIESFFLATDFGIRVSIHNLFPDLINDAYIAAGLSHEISHIYLKHLEKEESKIYELEEEYIKKCEQDTDDSQFNTEYEYSEDAYQYSDHYDLENYYKQMYEYAHTQTDYINLRRRQEIEADNFGFVLYLNAGFGAEYYKDSYLHKLAWNSLNPYSSLTLPENIKEELNNLLRLDKNSDFYTASYTNYHQSITLPLKDLLRFLDFEYDGDISRIIDHTKYTSSTETYPSSLWRFWSLYHQEDKKYKRKNKKVMNNTSLNTFYFRIDLTHLENLDEIKRFFSNKNNLLSDPDYMNLDDPRVYIIQKLLENDSEINFTLESYPKDQENIGYIEDDNTMLLRANDIFQLSYLLIKRYTYKPADPCAAAFSYDEPYPNFKQRLEHIIKFSFI